MYLDNVFIRLLTHDEEHDGQRRGPLFDGLDEDTTYTFTIRKFSTVPGDNDYVEVSIDLTTPHAPLYLEPWATDYYPMNSIWKYIEGTDRHFMAKIKSVKSDVVIESVTQGNPWMYKQDSLFTDPVFIESIGNDIIVVQHPKYHPDVSESWDEYWLYIFETGTYDGPYIGGVDIDGIDRGPVIGVLVLRYSGSEAMTTFSVKKSSHVEPVDFTTTNYFGVYQYISHNLQWRHWFVHGTSLEDLKMYSKSHEGFILNKRQRDNWDQNNKTTFIWYKLFNFQTKVLSSEIEADITIERINNV